jgi:hypothetical protein
LPYAIISVGMTAILPASPGDIRPAGHHFYTVCECGRGATALDAVELPPCSRVGLARRRGIAQYQRRR